MRKEKTEGQNLSKISPYFSGDLASLKTMEVIAEKKLNFIR